MTDPNEHDQPAEGGDLPEADQGADRSQGGVAQGSDQRPSPEQAERNREDDPPA